MKKIAQKIKDISIWGVFTVLSMITVAAIMAAMLALSFYIGFKVGEDKYLYNNSNFLSDVDRKREKAAIEDEIDKLLDIKDILYYYYPYEIDKEELYEGIFAGLVASLGDEYSYYITAEENEAILADASGEYYGVGVQLFQDYNSDEIEILMVYDNGPAEKAGILNGDKLVSVDGKKVVGKDLSSISNLISGPKDSQVTIEIERNGEILAFSMTRDNVEKEEAYWSDIGDNIAYLRIESFNNKHLGEQMEKAVEEISAAGINDIVLDLRNNPGGTVAYLEDAAKYLLPDCVMAEARAKREESSFTINSIGSEYEFNITCLVDEYTASSSEILAGALQDIKGSLIIGEQTYGKGVAQNHLMLSDGSAIHITFAEIFRPNGESLNNVGVIPDIEMESEFNSIVMTDPSKDTLVQRAKFEILNERK